MEDRHSSFIQSICPNTDQVELLRNSEFENVFKVFDEIFGGKNLKTNGVLLKLNQDPHHVTFSPNDVHRLIPLVGQYFGEALVQNENKDKVISVYDRDRLGTMWEGARYHQTREGGSIHTDNVNVPERWEILVLGCLAPAYVGGESILVDGDYIHQLLKEKYPDALSILEKNFYWEMRGVSDGLYESPIITYDTEKGALFRHLRPYMESAHRKAGVPLSGQQLYAIDVLDALLNSVENQFRIQMQLGDILITKDSKVLHGRACFSDSLEAVSYDEFMSGKGTMMKRTMERMWIKQ